MFLVIDQFKNDYSCIPEIRGFADVKYNSRLLQILQT